MDHFYTLEASGLGEQMGVKLGRWSPINSLKEIQSPFWKILSPWAAL